METVRASMMCDGGGDRFARGGPEPSMTLGWKPRCCEADAAAEFEAWPPLRIKPWFSGSLITSMAFLHAPVDEEEEFFLFFGEHRSDLEPFMAC
jgi:hypothetical protein